MTALLLLFLFMCVLGYHWPKFLIFFITVPLVGVGVGGLAWGITTIITMNTDLVTLPIFGGFLLGGIAVTFVGGFALDGCK